MPRPKPKHKLIRRNFTLYQDDDDRIRRFAELIAPPGEDPNDSMAVRVAIRQALERADANERATATRKRR